MTKLTCRLCKTKFERKGCGAVPKYCSSYCQKKAWKIENWDHYIQEGRKYREKNRDRRRRHYENNLEYYLRYSRRYAKDNRERLFKRHRIWREKNPENVRKSNYKQKYGPLADMFMSLVDLEKEITKRRKIG